MENDLVSLNQKIDQLTATIEDQRQRLEILESGNGSERLHQKLDYLVAQAEAQQRQREEFNELKRDVMPIANHMIKLSIDELAEIGADFQVEDLFFLVKRVLRDTDMLVEGLNRLEMMMDLYDETQFMGKQILHTATIKLDELERAGYFEFARSSWGIMERIVTEFSEEDVKALGDNIVTILNTVKNLTQPEIMNMTNNALTAIQDQPVEDGDVSLWGLLRDLSDPKVRKGMSRLLNLVKVLADQPNQPSQN